MATTDAPENTPPVDDAREELQDAVPKAAETLADLLDAEDERVRIRAAEAILDRAGVVKANPVSRTTVEREVGGKDTRSEYEKNLDDLL